MADYPPPQPPDPQSGYGAPPPNYGQQAPGYAAPNYGQPQYGYTAGPKTNVMAIVSLVSAIAGIFVLCGAGGLISIPLGFVALSQIKKSNGAETGRGLALGGIITGAVLLIAGAAFFIGVVLLADNVDNTIDDICEDFDTDNDGINDCTDTDTFDNFTTTTLGFTTSTLSVVSSPFG